MTTLLNTDLTTNSVAGEGIFDVLMRAVKAHLDEEFKRGTIKGPEYSTVYLGSLNLAMQTGLSFLLQKEKTGLEVSLLEKQLELAQLGVDRATIELAIITEGQAKVALEIAQLTAQNTMIGQQTANLVAEALNIPKQGEVLDAQKCKLQAEFDLTQASTTKVNGESELLAQKTATERAQILSAGVDADSVIGKQKTLYTAQSNGFARDAEQKAAKLMADTWSVRRTTDEATVADATNMLYDVAVGRAVNKLLDGVGA